MKNLNLLSLSLTLSILMLTSVNSPAQEVKGNGNVVKETRTIDSFNEIVVEGLVSVYLSQGSAESVVVETDKNLQPYVVTKLKGSTLTIRNKDDAEIEKSTKMNVYVTLKDINKLEINNVGKVESNGSLNLSSLKIDANGVGSTKLDLISNKLNVDFNSVGSLTLTGEITNVLIDHNGVGNIKAEDLSAEILKIDNNGVGNAEVNSSKEIYINLNGIGNVSYKGNAVVKEMNINGMGKVTKM